MPSSNVTGTNGATAHAAPEVVAPTNRVTVALPFSKVEILRPNDDVAELSEIVADLLQLMETFAPGAYVQRLRHRAQEIALRSR